jgi:hypothetical protein
MNDTRCSIDGCERNTVARGWCGAHYQRWRNHGDPTVTKHPMRSSGTPEERFWAKVDAFGVCWEWQAAKDTKGYGVFNLRGVLVRAHRFAYETLMGPVPEGLELDHLCRNRICVFPGHLEPVTHRVNHARGDASIRRSITAAQQTHCKRNHAFTRENTYRDKKTGARTCRTCHKERERKRRTETKKG